MNNEELQKIIGTTFKVGELYRIIKPIILVSPNIEIGIFHNAKTLNSNEIVLYLGSEVIYENDLYISANCTKMLVSNLAFLKGTEILQKKYYRFLPDKRAIRMFKKHFQIIPKKNICNSINTGIKNGNI